jgi:ribosome-associated heat shock protein Hsp15
MRLDSWLWAVRMFRTRTQATQAIRGGHVRVGGVPVKPAREVRVGEEVEVRTPGLVRTLQVLGFPDSRVGAPRVPEFCADRTPARALEAAREQRRFQASQSTGRGRPTKRDRRQREEWRGRLDSGGS